MRNFKESSQGFQGGLVGDKEEEIKKNEKGLLLALFFPSIQLGQMGKEKGIIYMGPKWVPPLN